MIEPSKDNLILLYADTKDIDQSVPLLILLRKMLNVLRSKFSIVDSLCNSTNSLSKEFATDYTSIQPIEA